MADNLLKAETFLIEDRDLHSIAYSVVTGLMSDMEDITDVLLDNHIITLGNGYTRVLGTYVYLQQARAWIDGGSGNQLTTLLSPNN